MCLLFKKCSREVVGRVEVHIILAITILLLTFDVARSALLAAAISKLIRFFDAMYEDSCGGGNTAAADKTFGVEQN